MLSLVKFAKPTFLADSLGWFNKTYLGNVFAPMDIRTPLIHGNHVLLAFDETTRGIQFQLPLHAQIKSGHRIRNQIIDYAVKLRRGPLINRQYIGVKFSTKNSRLFYARRLQLFLHHTGVQRKMLPRRSPTSMRSIGTMASSGCEPTIGTSWRLLSAGAVLSGKDQKLPAIIKSDGLLEYTEEPLEPFQGISADTEVRL